MYTPPTHNAIAFNFTTSPYTPPTHAAVNFSFGSSPPATTNRGIVALLIGL